jgi:hypothetical protein
MIADHLHDDRASLAACALACRAFVPVSRYHLFSSIRVRSRMYHDCTIAFSEHATFKIFVQEVTVEHVHTRQDLDSIFTALLSFPALSRLSIGYISKHSDHPHYSTDVRLENVTSLSLRTHFFRKWGNIFPILRIFPSIQQLTIDEVDFSYNGVRHLTTDYRFPSTLKDLKLTRCKPRRFFEDLVYWSLIPNLHTLVVAVHDPEELPSLGEFIGLLGQSLSILQLIFYGNDTIHLGEPTSISLKCRGLIDC